MNTESVIELIRRYDELSALRKLQADNEYKRGSLHGFYAGTIFSAITALLASLIRHLL